MQPARRGLVPACRHPAQRWKSDRRLTTLRLGCDNPRSSGVNETPRHRGGRKMKRIRSGAAFLAALALVLIVGGAFAQPYPARPVRIVVPTAPGGGNDFMARLVGQKLGERLGQQFIVDNRPG